MGVLFDKYQSFVNGNRICQSLNNFVNSLFFPFIIGLIVVISCNFALEVVCYPLIAILGIISLIVSKDTKPLISIILLFLMSASYKNGPSYNKDCSIPNIYDNKGIVIFFAILIAIVFLMAILNLLFYKHYKNVFKKSLCLLPGLIFLGLGYVLGGIGQGYDIKNLLFSLSNVGMIIVMVLYFSDTAFIDSNRKKTLRYISMVMVATFLVISLEVIGTYFINNVIVNDTIDKSQIVTGWGINNNFAGYINITIPFILYLSLSEDKPGKYYFLLILSAFIVLLTLSRNGILIIGVELLLCLIAILTYRKVEIKYILVSLMIILCGVSIILLTYYDKVINLFKHILNLGFSLNGRGELYEFSWKCFIERPIFGKGWFAIDDHFHFGVAAPNSFAPEFKAHNLFLQLLGSCGIVGLVGFLLFFAEISYKTFKNFSIEKCIYYSAIAVLIATSMLDNYFFDYGFERFLAVFITGLSICFNDKSIPVDEALN